MSKSKILCIENCFLFVFCLIVFSCSNPNPKLIERNVKINVDSLFFRDINNNLEISNLENLSIIRGFKSIKLGLNRDSVLWPLHGYPFDKWHIETIQSQKGIYLHKRIWSHFLISPDDCPKINNIPIFGTTLTFVEDTLVSILLDFRKDGNYTMSHGVVEEQLMSTPDIEEKVRVKRKRILQNNLRDKNLRKLLINAFGNPIKTSNDINCIKKILNENELSSFGTRTYRENGINYTVDFTYPYPKYNYDYWEVDSIYLTYKFQYYTTNSKIRYNYGDRDYILFHSISQSYKIGYIGIDEIVEKEIKIKDEFELKKEIEKKEQHILRIEKERLNRIKKEINDL